MERIGMKKHLDIVVPGSVRVLARCSCRAVDKGE